MNIICNWSTNLYNSPTFIVLPVLYLFFQFDNYSYESEYRYDSREGGEYDRGHYTTYAIPDDVKKYISYFRDAIREGHMYDIPSLYVE